MIESELNNDNLLYRYERKFRVEVLEDFQIKNLIDLHPAIFSPIYHERFINNIYFDTPNMESLEDNITGNTHRYKVRIRWYGELFGHIAKPTLEIKIKNGNVGTKLSFSLGAFDFNGSLNDLNFNQIFHDAELPENIRIYVCNWLPSMVNRYCRVYYLSADDKFRLTLDTNLSYGPVHSPHFPVKMIDYMDSGKILELKYAVEDDKQAQKISGYFPFRPTKNSKYISGLTLNSF